MGSRQAMELCGEGVNGAMVVRYDTYEFGLVAFFHSVKVSKAPFKLTPRVNIAM